MSLKYLEMEAKDYDNIVTWDNENLSTSINKFHLKMSVKANDVQIFQVLPVSKLQSLCLNLLTSSSSIIANEIIANSIKTVPHLILDDFFHRSELIQFMLLQKCLPKSLTIVDYTIRSKVALDTAVLLSKLTKLV